MVVDTKVQSYIAPGFLLVGNLVIATMFNNILEHLEQVNLRITNFRLRVKLGSTLGVELPQLCHELFILGSTIDSVRWCLLGSHCGWC